MDSQARLVGQDDALRTARALLADLAAGSGSFLLITGEPGSGKSALLAQVAREASRSGARVLRATCWDGAGTPPYWPWTQVLRDAERALPLGELGCAAQLLSTQRPTPPGSAAESADAQFRLFDDMTMTLRRMAASGPLVVLLDDLQWADGPSLRLLAFLRNPAELGARAAHRRVPRRR